METPHVGTLWHMQTPPTGNGNDQEDFMC